MDMSIGVSIEQINQLFFADVSQIFIKQINFFLQITKVFSPIYSSLKNISPLLAASSIALSNVSTKVSHVYHSTITVTEVISIATEPYL
jgi:hypothetical protein